MTVRQYLRIFATGEKSVKLNKSAQVLFALAMALVGPVALAHDSIHVIAAADPLVLSIAGASLAIGGIWILIKR